MANATGVRAETVALSPFHSASHASHHARGIGVRERWLAHGWTSVTNRAVTWRDGLGRLTVDFSSFAAASAGPASGSQPVPRRCPMATTTPSAALVPVAPVFTNTERLALAGFLAAYSGLTRQAYELDLRQFASWCQQHQLRLFQARRARPPAPPGLRIPRHRPGPQRARRAPGHRRARPAGRTRADLPAGPQRAARLRSNERRRRGARHRARHRTLVITRKGGRSSPSRSYHAPRGQSTWQSASEAKDPSSWRPMGGGWTAIAPDGSSARSPAGPGSPRPSGRIPSGIHHRGAGCGGSATRRAGSGLPRCPRTTMRYDRARTSLDRHATYMVAAYVAGAAR
jgi:hypothetical protein